MPCKGRPRCTICGLEQSYHNNESDHGFAVSGPGPSTESARPMGYRIMPLPTTGAYVRLKRGFDTVVRAAVNYLPDFNLFIVATDHGQVFVKYDGRTMLWQEADAP